MLLNVYFRLILLVWSIIGMTFNFIYYRRQNRILN